MSRARERTIYTIGRFLLAAMIVASATILAWKGLVEGQAIVGFLGAAISYVLARSTPKN